MKAHRAHKLSGIMLIALFSFSAFYIAEFDIFKQISFSPMIIGIILGMIYANSLRNHLPQEWVPGIIFCSKTLLRAAIIFYGFRLTIQNVMSVGSSAIIIDTIIVTTVIILGLLIGKWLKLDRDLTILTAAGSAICGAAAVLGTEPVLDSKPHKTAVAVSTVVIFGTIAMFLYPMAYRAGNFDLTPVQMGLYTGSTLHEVAHVVGAGNAMNDTMIANNAVIVKMIRVILLAPFLIILGFFIKPKNTEAGEGKKRKITIPWFAVGFLLVIGFNSLDLVPKVAVDTINSLDTFALTMAMTALGAESSFEKFKKAGFKPFLMALILFAWLMTAGYFLAKYV